MGAGRQREVHLPRVRLLLVANAEEPPPQNRKAENQQEEVSSLVEGVERLDQEIAVMAVENDPE